MSGYTPLFSSLITGTLYGRWPDIGLWTIVLSLADRHGVVDVTPDYLAGVTGLAATEVVACMQRFCEPDPKSRTKTEDGARLVLIDADRDWGWRIVNHGKYREKARLMGKAEQERESGKNAERMKDRRRPPKTAADPPSDSDSDSDKNKNPPTPQGGKPAKRGKTPKTELPEGFSLDGELRAYAESKLPQVDVVAMFEGFCGKAKSKGWAYSDWRQAWQEFVRNAMPNSGHWAAGQFPKVGTNGVRWQ